MNESGLLGKLAELLRGSTTALCDWLSHALPQLDPKWWRSLVLSNLSYSQRERVDREGIDSLRQLDLAALLRVMDRNYLKEMQSVRNRWAHLDAYGINEDDMYRDVDTLQRFLKIIEAPEVVVADILARPVVFGTLIVEGE